MPVLVQNKLTSVNGENGVISLLNAEVTGNDFVSVDRVDISAGGGHVFETGPSDIAWLCILDGGGTIGDQELTSSHAAAVPPSSQTTLVARSDMSVLWALVPNAERFDREIRNDSDGIKLTDWGREPVLQSEHDARTRIYVATPALSGTTAIKGEMVTYPPGTKAPQHHHEGAEHFQYVMSGSGVAVLNGAPHVLNAGDILYNYENEPHYFYNEANSGADFRFVEFFVPGECETVWAPEANLCAWLPTGRDSGGQKPAREIGYHVHGEDDGI